MYLDNGELLASFEYTANKDSIGYLINTSLNKPVRKVQFDKSLCYRITDLCKSSTGDIYGINVSWGGEYENYVKDCGCKTGVEAFDTLRRNNSSLYSAQIIQLTRLPDSSFSWKAIKNLGNVSYNWEGIAVVDEYFFVVSDANKGGTGENETHLGTLRNLK